MSDGKMTPQAAAGWTEFFTTAASAAATLMGLIIVAAISSRQRLRWHEIASLRSQ